MKKNKNYVDLKDQPVPEGQHLLEVDDLKMYFLSLIHISEPTRRS